MRRAALFQSLEAITMITDDHQDDDRDLDDEGEMRRSQPDDADALRDRCVLGVDCIASDPYHGPDECWTAEMAEAYYADLGAVDA